MIMWIAVIIIVILMFLDKDESKKIKAKENEIIAYNTQNGRPILRKYVNITGYDTRTGRPKFEYKKPIIGYHPQTGDPIFEGEVIPEVREPKQPLTEEEKTRLSNTILIIAGAILIVLASIIFLATGWETMNGILKTLILFGIQMTFSLFAYISNKKLDIPKIGKMFSYLTLAFVPIVLLSLSFFELVGDYFSISGDGFTYYIGISLIVSDLVYKMYGKIKKDIFTKRCSLIVEALAILFIARNINIVYIDILAMILHTIIVYILLQGGFLDKEAYKGLNDFYSIILIIVAALPNDISIMSFTNLILLAISFFVRCLDAKDDSEKRPLLVLFFISYLLSIRIIERVEISHYFLYLLSLIPILGLTKVVSTENMKKNIIRVVGVLIVILTASAAFSPEKSIYYLLTYVIGCIVSFLMYMLNNKSFYKLWSYLSFSAIFFTICYITGIEGVSEYILLVVSIFVYILEIVFDKLKDKTSDMFIVGCLCAEVYALNGGYYMIIPLVLLVIYLLLEKGTEDMIIPMIYSYVLFTTENETLLAIVFGSLSVVYTLLSVAKQNFNKYTIFSLATIIIICLYLELNAYVLWGSTLIWGILHCLLKKQENKEIYQTAVIFSLFGIYSKSLIDLDSSLYSNVALGVVLVSISMTKGVMKKANHILAGVIECIIIGLLTIVGAFLIQDPLDGVIYLGILLVLSILSYTKNWKFYLYSSIVSLIFGILVLTFEYWKEIPWYVYILFIGLALIIFAMFDEKIKQNKRAIDQQAESNINVIIESVPTPVVTQPVTEPTVTPLEQEMVEDKNVEEKVEEKVQEKETIVGKKAPKIEIVEDTSSNPSVEHNLQPKNSQKKTNNTTVSKKNSQK